MAGIAPTSTNAVPLMPVPAGTAPSIANQLARAVLVTDALQSATSETLEKALTPDGQDLATVTRLQLETAALGVWTALTTELIRANKENVNAVARNLSSH